MGRHHQMPQVVKCRLERGRWAASPRQGCHGLHWNVHSTLPSGFPMLPLTEDGLFMLVAKQCSICIAVLSQMWSLKNLSFVYL